MQTVIMAKLPQGLKVKKTTRNAKIFIWPFCALFIRHEEMQEQPEMLHVCAESTPGVDKREKNNSIYIGHSS